MPKGQSFYHSIFWNKLFTKANAAHHKAVALAVRATSWWLGQPVLQLAGTVLLFHSALDRLLGYGLKYASGFRDTHLGHMGAGQSAVAAN